ncbi:MAG: sensor domain-containing diguanylate cyclase, partial [Acidobacteria bacterium]|nr:sensor domain-containing diguanylate cyclase [Acidobacteriota bacterium]
GCSAFDRAQDVFKFAGLSAGVSTAVSATIGVTSLALGGFADWAQFGPIWLTWWLGDAAGALVVAPLLILWGANPPPRWPWFHWLEITLLLLCLIIVGQFVFGPLSSWEMKNYPLEFLCIPFLIWAAFRLGQREGTLAMTLLSGIAIWGTLRGFGPFVRHTQNESLLLLQAFMGVCAVMTLSLASVVLERRRAEEQLRQLAVTDPLTGLANYRHLMQVLDQEIQRSERTYRSFAVLMLDLDGLKKINDAYGHLVGTRALCRLAGLLSRNCRAIDTAARYGGDEFAVILVETGVEEARQIARRIAEELAQESEQPRLFVSVGVAVYPQNGATREALLAAADRSLYEDKSANRKGRLTPPRSFFPSLR